ncbi:nucleoside-binding protein [Pseudoalteromonas fenneropenaei]|uniref:Nucleoside-binding protein n=1 Tax=Pseudoalteromonas fenneropenaei TaxID=1737459 RepID=A0ABV7CPX6_9GAMM
MKQLSAIAFCTLMCSSSVMAANWSTTQLHLNHGEFKNPFSQQQSNATIYSLQHVSGYDYGDNFFFIDYTKDDLTDGYQDGDFYGEWYSALSLSKTLGGDWSFGAVKDVSAVMGINAAGDAKVMKYLPGVKLHWDLPGFTFFSTSLTGYIDDSSGLAKQGAPTESNSWMLDIAWGYPFMLGSQKFLLTGHVEYIDGRRNELGSEVKDWILAQPILEWDLGYALGNKENTLMLGVEWQYWRNKLGTDTDESVPQIHLAWTF